MFDHLRSLCAEILFKTVRERVKNERAARSNLGPADSRGNRISQGKPSLPGQGPAGSFSFPSPVLASSPYVKGGCLHALILLQAK